MQGRSDPRREEIFDSTKRYLGEGPSQNGENVLRQHYLQMYISGRGSESLFANKHGGVTFVRRQILFLPQALNDLIDHLCFKPFSKKRLHVWAFSKPCQS